MNDRWYHLTFLIYWIFTFIANLFEKHIGQRVSEAIKTVKEQLKESSEESQPF